MLRYQSQATDFGGGNEEQVSRQPFVPGFSSRVWNRGGGEASGILVRLDAKKGSISKLSLIHFGVHSCFLSGLTSHI